MARKSQWEECSRPREGWLRKLREGCACAFAEQKADLFLQLAGQSGGSRGQGGGWGQHSV